MTSSAHFHWTKHRQPINDLTRELADHSGEWWQQHEVDLLLEWDGSEAELLALVEMLGRSAEACRFKYYAVKGGRHKLVVTPSSHPNPVETNRRSKQRPIVNQTYHYNNWPEDERGEWYA